MLNEFIQNAKFLVVDDELSILRLLELTLEKWGFGNVWSTTDSREVTALFNEHQPDLILLDFMMPHLDGFQVIERLKPLTPPGAYLPIVMLTADANPATKRRALAAGAKDFLIKPFDQNEILLRIYNLLETRYLHMQLQDQNRLLEERVRERTYDLEASQMEVLQRLARAAEFRDDDSGEHTQRVGEMAALVAHELGMSNDEVEVMWRAAPLHDVGKIAISDLILLKPGKLTTEEFETMKMHTTTGAELLSGGRSELVKMAASIAVSHHERWDGSGYPYGLKGEDIPLPGRIVAIVDVFDALTHKRPYKTVWSEAEALAEIQSQNGKQFDPRVVAAFLKIKQRAALAEPDTPQPDERQPDEPHGPRVQPVEAREPVALRY